MGLKSGADGVKALCKKHFSDSFRDFLNLHDARVAMSKKVSQTAVFLDGNVLMQAVPTELWSLDQYVKLIEMNTRQAFDAGDVVVVVFDDRVTKAKQAEQERRDLQRRKSEPQVSSDLQDEFCPVDDNYTEAQIDGCVNIHSLMSHRKARSRLFDIVCNRVMKQFLANQKQSLRASSPSRTLIFDGIDSRGGDRPFGEKRMTGFYCSDSILDDRLERDDDMHVGEGDVKLSELQSRIHNLKLEKKAFLNIELIIVCTVDTDSIGIELVRLAAEKHSGTAKSPIDVVFAFRERPVKRKGDDSSSEPTTSMASYATFHSQSLYEGVVGALFGNEADKMIDVQPLAVVLLVGLWVLCGSDFVALRGMKVDVAIEAVANIVADDVLKLFKMKELLSIMNQKKNATLDNIFKAARASDEVIESGVAECVDVLKKMPRMQRSVSNASNRLPGHAKRASWVLLYWGVVPEKKLSDLDRFGFDEML